MAQHMRIQIERRIKAARELLNREENISVPVRRPMALVWLNVFRCVWIPLLFYYTILIRSVTKSCVECQRAHLSCAALSEVSTNLLATMSWSPEL